MIFQDSHFKEVLTQRLLNLTTEVIILEIIIAFKFNKKLLVTVKEGGYCRRLKVNVFRGAKHKNIEKILFYYYN